ncbi:MAG: response regulator [Bacteroidota bacterium]|nr:response regulator [Bacteroidota bacterium]MDX5429768.1 response regulator [Bacteroidota bacterium]MDX5468547.1 response regulator [Bacteroidota bacterium]
MKTFHILLVDDNEIDLFLHEKLIRLSEICHRIDSFTTAQEALDFLEKSEDRPDVILLDIQMPEMDGFDFLKHYELIPGLDFEKIRIFMVSSSLDFGDISKAKANPLVAEFMKKPLNMKELVSLLGRD